MAADTYHTIMFGAPDAPPAPPPAPPAPPAPPGTCPKQTTANATTVCLSSVDTIGCATTLSCPAGQHFVNVDFAAIGAPSGSCGNFAASSTCHGTPGAAARIVAKLCLGKLSCKVAPNTNTMNPADPNICSGVVKHTMVQLQCGKGSPTPPPPGPPPPPPPPGPAEDCSGPFSHWRDCHFADALSPSLLKHLLKVEGVSAK